MRSKYTQKTASWHSHIDMKVTFAVLKVDSNTGTILCLYHQ